MNKVHKTLEFNKVLELISIHAISPDARQKVLDMKQALDIEQAQLWINHTTDAKHLISVCGSPNFAKMENPASSITRANACGTLNTREILEIAVILKTARNLKNYSELETSLSPLFSKISSNKYLEEKIFKIIISEDEISNNASTELARIRRKIINLSSKGRDTLSKFTNSKFLQENLITMRSGRYVIPVKSEHKGDVPGLVHDISASGATLFIEPNAVVEINNELRREQALEKQEIERILSEISAEISDFSETILTDFSYIIELDFIFSKAKFSYHLNCSNPILNNNCETNLVKARHPLIKSDIVVPINISIGGKYDTLVITGPNTGGKTVSIKCMGLLVLMACCGLHIPANEESTIAFTKNIYADIGDEQSIEQSLSTFSSHMTNIVRILKVCQKGDLVLFDELGAGTDPVEGAALAIAIIEYARQKSINVMATTHYSEIKMYALTTDGIENASLEFDVASLKPTYKILTGVPGKSNAFSIAKKLGLDLDIIERAKAQISTENAKFEDVIIALEQERTLASKKTSEYENLKRNAQSEKDKISQISQNAESERDKIIRIATEQADRILKNAKNASDSIFKEISEIKKGGIKNLKEENLKKAKESIQGTLKLGQTPKKVKKTIAPDDIENFKVGDDVELINIGAYGTILSIKADAAVVLAGILKTSVRLNEIKLLKSTKKQKQQEYKRISSEPIMRNSASEINVCGLALDEAMMEVDQFISDCLMSGYETAFIIHGKGTGVLRVGLQKHLKSQKHIKSFRDGKYGEGENGVTVVSFR